MNSAQLLTQIVTLSRDMQMHAVNGEWEQVGEIQQTRQKLIDDCFPLDESVSGPDRAGEQIKIILDLDKQIMEIGRSMQRELGETLVKISQGRQATKIYQDTSTGS